MKKTGEKENRLHLQECLLFKRKKLNPQRLISSGFAEQDQQYVRTFPLVDGQFSMTVVVSKAGDVCTRLFETDSGEEYILHRVPWAKGAFVGKVRKEYEDILTFISTNGFDPDVFQSDDTREIIRYIHQTYGDEPEFLWPRFPDNAIFRRKDTGKWYGAVLVVSKRKLGLAFDEQIEILDLRIKPENMEALVDNERYFPGYHMNKKHWFTICLDGTVSLDEICRHIDESYRLATK